MMKYTKAYILTILPYLNSFFEFFYQAMLNIPDSS